MRSDSSSHDLTADAAMNWFNIATRPAKSKYVVPPTPSDDEGRAATISSFADSPMEGSIDTTSDATFVEYQQAFRQVEKTLSQVDETFHLCRGVSNISSDTDSNHSKLSEESFHFGGRQELSSDDEDGTLTSSLHADATFIEVPETHPLPESVEIQLVHMMKRIVKLEKYKKKNKEQRLALHKKVQTLQQELEKSKQETLEAEAMAGMTAQSSSSALLRTQSGKSLTNSNKEKKLLEQQKQREQNRKRLFAGLAEDDGDEDNGGSDGFDSSNPMGSLFHRLLRSIRTCWRKNIPFRSDLIVIKSRYGGSTASFFVFFRWLFVNNLAIFLLQSLFFSLHLSQLLSRGHQVKNV